MRLVLALLAVLGGAAYAGDEQTAFPWQEFKELYRQSIEREVVARMTPPPPAKLPQVFVLDEARYRLEAGREFGQGDVLISGRILSGDPETIPLLGNDVVLGASGEVRGGQLVAVAGENALGFLPDPGTVEFQASVSFLVPARSADGKFTLEFKTPAALRNSLALVLPEGVRLLDHPGIATADGVYHFGGGASVSVAFADGPAEPEVAPPAVIELDTLARITVQKGRVFVNTWFDAVRPVTESVTLLPPPDAQYVSSSLPASRVKKLDNGRYALRPGEVRETFSVEFALELPKEGNGIAFPLPSVENNNGNQGRFIVFEPDDSQVTPAANGLIGPIPIERLGERLAKNAEGRTCFMSVPPEESLRLELCRFQPVSAPVTVLDNQWFFASFEENGNILSVLVLDVPPEFGARLRLKAVPGAEVWSLSVNGIKKTVFAGEEGVWVIPLENGKSSRVELAFLRNGPKLGLQGKLEALVPETGIASQRFSVGIALPERVEALSLEGPVSPADGAGWELPAGFAGKPHFFARSFHKGEAMTLTVLYKEPVESGGAPALSKR